MNLYIYTHVIIHITIYVYTNTRKWKVVCSFKLLFNALCVRTGEGGSLWTNTDVVYVCTCMYCILVGVCLFLCDCLHGIYLTSIYYTASGRSVYMIYWEHPFSNVGPLLH